jgi:hypothetical protein
LAVDVSPIVGGREISVFDIILRERADGVGVLPFDALIQCIRGKERGGRDERERDGSVGAREEERRGGEGKTDASKTEPTCCAPSSSQEATKH